LAVNPALQFTEFWAAAYAFAAGERDVRMVETRLGHVPAQGGRRCDALMEGAQFGSEPDTGTEDPGAVEEA
jgi:hypothetical protein